MSEGVLVDTSVWVAHFRTANDRLVELLENDRVLTHPLIRGEIACGTPPARERTLDDLSALRPAEQATIDEVIDFINRRALHGKGCGLVDLTLLASTLMTSGARLWTLDRRLASLAGGLACEFT